MKVLEKAFSSSTFMLASIFATISTCTSISSGSFDLIGLFVMIFMWIIFSGARKGKLTPVNVKNLGTMVKINFVLAVIGWVFLALVTVGIILGTIIIGQESLMTFITELVNQVQTSASGVISDIVAVGVVWIIVACLVGATVIYGIQVFAGLATIKKFTGSVVDKAFENGEIHHVKSAMVWFYILAGLAILTGIGPLGMGSLVALCNGGERIALGLLLKAYLDGKFNSPEDVYVSDATDISWDEPSESQPTSTTLNGEVVNKRIIK